MYGSVSEVIVVSAKSDTSVQSFKVTTKLIWTSYSDDITVM